MDFITDLPRSHYRGSWYDTVWVIVDRFSKRTYTYPVRKTTTAEELTELFMQEYVFKEMNGLPLVIISDRDKLLTSKHFKNLMKRMGVEVRLSSARSQQTNGLVERKNAVLEEVLRSSVNYN